MSRIADKHGLTNKYRQVGMGKRVVRRGRPRKYLLGPPKHNKRSTTYNVSETESKIVAIILSCIAGMILCWFAPIFIPIVGGTVLIGVGDIVLKKIWNLPSGKWSAPASWGWMILTGLEMIISFFMGVFVLIDEAPIYVLVIDVIIYVFLSALILYKRHKKIKNNQGVQDEDDFI